MGIAVARHAHSVCTAVVPATMSLDYVIVCQVSQALSAMKVEILMQFSSLFIYKVTF